MKGNPYAEALEGFTGQHMELDATLALAHEQRTANLLALTEQLGTRSGISEDQLAQIEQEILQRLGIEN